MRTGTRCGDGPWRRRPVHTDAPAHTRALARPAGGRPWPLHQGRTLTVSPGSPRASSGREDPRGPALRLRTDKPRPKAPQNSTPLCLPARWEARGPFPLGRLSLEWSPHGGRIPVAPPASGWGAPVTGAQRPLTVRTSVSSAPCPLRWLLPGLRSESSSSGIVGNLLLSPGLLLHL